MLEINVSLLFCHICYPCLACLEYLYGEWVITFILNKKFKIASVRKLF